MDNISLEWAKLADVGELKPDAVLLLDLPLEKAQTRSGFGDERFEVNEFQKRVYNVIKMLADDDRDLWKVSWIIVY